MSTISERELKTFLAPLSPSVRTIVLALRETILKTVPDVEESILWGGLSYHLPELGGRVKGAVCQIVTKRFPVRLDFIHGVWLRDPVGLLEGSLVSKRFVSIATAADAKRPEIAALIREAAVLDRTTFVDHIHGT